MRSDACLRRFIVLRAAFPSLEATLTHLPGLGAPVMPQDLSAAHGRTPDPPLTGDETVQELVGQLMGPEHIIDRQDRRRSALDLVLRRYEDKEREVEALNKVGPTRQLVAHAGLRYSGCTNALTACS